MTIETELKTMLVEYIGSLNKTNNYVNVWWKTRKTRDFLVHWKN